MQGSTQVYPVCFLRESGDTLPVDHMEFAFLVFEPGLAFGCSWKVNGAKTSEIL